MTAARLYPEVERRRKVRKEDGGEKKKRPPSFRGGAGIRSPCAGGRGARCGNRASWA